ncbi:hypothetical protein C8A01DRAFT_38194 [Parachaetomium inaequale]|uniref:F-box domain-containing protein n=1 Tax=Parachaetomium inaequale TaxID=2588326 RepID=A0AAN6PBG1_9PEZI|nr:hypothetical protein C8A01DRAFT_38194 [Parachaetomium inaequale]
MAEPDDQELALPKLELLPFDILRIIVWSEALSQDDVAALRLTCRALVDVAATRLFYRIAISKLNVDRDIFLSICHSPHLAAHVHEVEWLEISWDVDLFDGISAPAWFVNAPDHDAEAVGRYFQGQAEAAFWLRNVPARPPAEANSDTADIESGRQKAVAEFKTDFEATVDLLPNLHTFASRPMTSTRIINDIDSEYPMTADYFQRFQDTPRAPEIVPQTNDGLFLFLLPAMDRPTSTIIRLRWADEFPGFSYLRRVPTRVTICASALVRYINEKQPNEHCHSSANFEDDGEDEECDAYIRSWVEDKAEHTYATTPKFEDEASDTTSTRRPSTVSVWALRAL